MKLNSLVLFLLLTLVQFDLFAQSIKWTVVAPGVWKATIGRPELYDLLSASGSKPNMLGLKKWTLALFQYQNKRLSGK